MSQLLECNAVTGVNGTKGMLLDNIRKVMRMCLIYVFVYSVYKWVKSSYEIEIVFLMLTIVRS